MNLLDSLEEKLQAKRYERYLLALCPFHDDQKPSFFVYEDSYRCLACGKFGKTKDLLNKLNGIEIAPIKLSGNNPFSKWLNTYESLEIVLFKAHSNVRKSPSHYLKSRGIDHETQSKLKLGLLDGWITFPILDSENYVVGAVARKGEGNNSSSKYVLPNQQDPNLLYVPSWPRIKNVKRREVFITFGIIDAITLYMCGYASASTTTGKHINPSAFNDIRKRILFVPDNGELKEANIIASKLGWRGHVINLQYPIGSKDPNDLWLQDKDVLYGLAIS